MYLVSADMWYGFGFISYFFPLLQGAVAPLESYPEQLLGFWVTLLLFSLHLLPSSSAFFCFLSYLVLAFPYFL